MQDTYDYDILSKFESSIDGVLLFSMILVVICICVFIAIIVSKFIYIVWQMNKCLVFEEDNHEPQQTI